MKAVILAAGCATRLRPHTDDMPKTLLSVDGTPILRRTLSSLMQLGFDEFVIGTGYLEHKVQTAVAQWFPELNVRFVSNPDFRSTNNAYSLWLTAEHVQDDAFILLDGDVVFDLAVVQSLLAHGPDCLAVRSTGDIGLEEMKVRVNERGHVTEISKHVPVSAARGESVGIELFSAATSKKLFSALDERIRAGGDNEYYEAAFQQIIDDGCELATVDIGRAFAAEIDTIEDLRSVNAVLASRHAPAAAASASSPSLRVAV